MKFCIIIPAHNEEDYIHQTLSSLCNQSLPPSQLIVVDDHSTDTTPLIVRQFSEKFNFVQLVSSTSSQEHLPGSKVINAFYKGLRIADDNFDVICKFDADLIFPANYLESLEKIFANSANCGLAGGVCTVLKNDRWVIESLTDKDHVRGALKAYRKRCFEEIGQIKRAMGWDTVDELLIDYYNWEVAVDESLLVKHLKPTGQVYDQKARYKYGQALHSMRYGFWLTLITSLKSSYKKRKLVQVFDFLKGFFIAVREKEPFIVTADEGKFIRKYRWKKMVRKLF
jgi:glycosyltransferase involved in cell wall biosynthesis